MSDTATARTPYRTWFLVDGVVTGTNALAYLLLHQLLPELTGSAAELYVTAGVVLLIITVALLVVACTPRRLRVLPELLAFVNILWAAGSFLVAWINPFELTALGVGWTVAQGVIVLAFAILQLRSLPLAAGVTRKEGD